MSTSLVAEPVPVATPAAPAAWADLSRISMGMGSFLADALQTESGAGVVAARPLQPSRLARVSYLVCCGAVLGVAAVGVMSGLDTAATIAAIALPPATGAAGVAGGYRFATAHRAGR